MCLGGAKTPEVQPLPPPAPPAPTQADPAIKRAKTMNKQRAALAAGRSSTINTNPGGLESDTGSGKTLLGA